MFDLKSSSIEIQKYGPHLKDNKNDSKTGWKAHYKNTLPKKMKEKRKKHFPRNNKNYTLVSIKKTEKEKPFP